jgi:hypothetical protein
VVTVFKTVPDIQNDNTLVTPKALQRLCTQNTMGIKKARIKGQDDIKLLETA